MNTDRNLQAYVDLYSACLTDPSRVMSRVPDAFKRPTALVHSRQVVDVPVSSNGNWAVCCQPKLGGLNSPQAYKLAVVNPSATGDWPADLSQPSAFLTQGGTGDPRLDPNTAFLTQPVANYTEWIWDTSSWITGTGYFNPNAATTSALSHGMAPYLQVSSVNANFTQVYLTGGAYQVTVYYQSYPGRLWNSVTAATLTPWTPADPDVTIVRIITEPTGLPYLPNADFVTGYTEQYIVAVNAPQGSFSLGNAFDGVLYSTADPILGSISVTIAPIGSATTSVRNNLGVATVAPSTLNSGIVQQLRPVAMCALVTYVGPSINDGGQIAVAQVQGSTVNQQFFINSQNSLANFNVLSQYQGAINHDLRKGAYVFWTPESAGDTIFHPPQDANAFQYPSLVMGGSYRSSVALSGVTTGVMRLQVDTVYEFTTTSQLFVTRTLAGSQACLDEAWVKVNAMVQVMENPQHGERLRKFASRLRTFAGKGIDFYKKNKSWIDPAVGTLLI